jgi:hypothetical protein
LFANQTNGVILQDTVTNDGKGFFSIFAGITEKNVRMTEKSGGSLMKSD